jgi:uncharacterized metal-binding protein (TIGR02443 family)
MVLDDWAEASPYSEYEGIGIRCPKCSSDDIVYEDIDGYLSFSECNDCGFKKQRKTSIKV